MNNSKIIRVSEDEPTQVIHIAPIQPIGKDVDMFNLDLRIEFLYYHGAIPE